MKTLLTASLLLPLAVAVPAAAQQPATGHERGHGRMMERLDANKDGAIDRSEFQSARADRFARLDTDGDGRIAQADFADAVERARAARKAERITKLFSRLDADGDGVLTSAEYAAAGDATFARMDRDGDGRLTPKSRGQQPHGGGEIAALPPAPHQGEPS